ncbi:GNAT family N-acetyltransferase [Gilvimarinus agarilyticus]|uniref:GNAT family N-acetyltransferase n=1 Tax=Gilvimarinus agarilyticus TaxID=679259 RepID=UPI000695C394|nr:GNAT family N-acetyltransferase [Gilvimarinus agarilyticus]
MKSTNQFQCNIVTWGEASAPLCHIRRRVFIEEQNVPPELEWELADHEATHFLLCTTPYLHHSLGQAVACARILRERHNDENHFHIGRVAVLAQYRGNGIGTMLIRELLHWCQSQSDYKYCEQVFLHAQCDVIPFYTMLGFSAVGDTFMDAGIEHRTMLLRTVAG